MSFIDELKRRNVHRVGIAYVATVWVLIQVADTVLPALDAPSWVLRTIIVSSALGFPLALVIAWYYELTPEGIRSAADLEPVEAVRFTRRKVDFVIIGLLVIAIGFLLMRSPPGEQDSVLPNSVAVLPFVNLSPDPENFYFATGIHNEILNSLSRLRALNVIGRTSVMRYADTQKSVPEIALELNVETIMEGTIRFDGNRARITSQLIDASTGVQLWAEAYDKDIDDIFDIQLDIAMNVSKALEAELSPTERQRISRKPTDSSAAYILYLQYLNLIGTGNQGPQVLTMLEQMIESDPEFAEPYGQKAYIFANMLVNTIVGPAGERSIFEPLALKNAQRALELDPYSSSAHSALAILNLYTWQWSEAQEIYESYYQNTGQRALFEEWFHSWMDRDAAAIEVAQRAVSLNPNDWSAPWFYGLVLLSAGAYDAAVESFRTGVALAPTLPVQRTWLAWAEIARGEEEAALQELRIAERLLTDNRTLINVLDIAYGYGRLGRTEDAARLFDEVQARTAESEIGVGGRAIAALAVGDTQRALELIRLGAEKAENGVLDEGFLSLMVLRVNATNDPVLNQAEFVELRARLAGS